MIIPILAQTLCELCTEVGKQNEALETLHHAILHKRWKNQWSSCGMFKFLNSSQRALHSTSNHHRSMINVSLSDY